MSIRVVASQFTCTVLMIVVNKVVNIPYGENVAFLKKMIAESFDFSISDFSLFVNMKPLGPEEDDTMIKEIGFSVVYVIRKLQDIKPRIHPKNLLVGNQEFFNLMFDLLSNETEYDVENIWKLLMKLPQDEVPTAKKLEKLDIESEDEWKELVDGQSLHKLLYALQVIERSMQADADYQNKFLVLRGYHHLFKTFLEIDPSKVTSTLAFKSVDILCRKI
jgi:hypothetical protein